MVQNPPQEEVRPYEENHIGVCTDTRFRISQQDYAYGENNQFAKASQSDNMIVTQFHLMILNFPSFNKIQRPQPRTPQFGPTQ